MSLFHVSWGKICKYKTSFACPSGGMLLQIEPECYICKMYIKMGCKCLRNSFLLQFTWHYCHCINKFAVMQMMWVLISITKSAHQFGASEKKMVIIILKMNKITSKPEDNPWGHRPQLGGRPAQHPKDQYQWAEGRGGQKRAKGKCSGNQIRQEGAPAAGRQGMIGGRHD